MSQYLFSSESVSEGHPDKVADQISDGVLDAILAQDPKARVACETLTSTGLIVISGEITTSAQINYIDVARDVVRRIGYNSSEIGFDYQTCAVLTALNRQSPDIAQGVDEGRGLDLDQGAGDQGLMFGYACEETPVLMPYPIWLAHRLVERQAQVRKSGDLPWLRPDAKSQVTVRYEGDRCLGVQTVVLSTQIAPGLDADEVAQTVTNQIVLPLVPEDQQLEGFRVLVNPAGPFEIGGPNGDTGLTGRKIIVDTYGGSCPHGGGAFSGKDPTKVDRSAAYMARYVAKNVVAAKLARRCTVQLAYAIGIPDPVSVLIDSHGTGVVSDDALEDAVQEVFDLTPRGIIETLELRRPIYRKTAAYGHFGREEPGFSWEKADQAPALRQQLA